MKQVLKVLAAGMLLAANAHIGTLAAFELHHDEGSIQLADAPVRIATYDLAILDSLQALGISGVSGVPKSSLYHDALADYADTPVIGTLFEPDYDALKSLAPDLIFAGRRSVPAMPELEKLAPTAIYQFRTDAFMESFSEHNLALGRAFGKEAQARALLDEINADITTLKERNQGKTGALLFTINGILIAHAPGERFGYSHELTGLQPVLAARPASAANAPRPKPGTPEAEAAQAERARVISEVAKANPDWLIVLDRGAINKGEKTAAATLAGHPEISQTDAFRNGRVVYVNPDAWYIVTGGLNNMRSIMKSLLTEMQ